MHIIFSKAKNIRTCFSYTVYIYYYLYIYIYIYICLKILLKYLVYSKNNMNFFNEAAVTLGR